MLKKLYSILMILALLNFYANQLYAQTVPSCYVGGYYPTADTSVSNGPPADSLYADSFTITLQGGWGIYTGWVVSESTASPGTDTCYTTYSNPSLIPPHPGVSGGSWLVSGTANWGPDKVGWLPASAQYIKANAGTIYVNLPCMAQINQKLEIDCPGDSTPYPYNPNNPLTTFTGAVTIQNCRGNLGEGATCGNTISY